MGCENCLILAKLSIFSCVSMRSAKKEKKNYKNNWKINFFVMVDIVVVDNYIEIICACIIPRGIGLSEGAQKNLKKS